MTEENEISYTERQAGIYPSEFLGVSDFEYTDPATNEIEKRWRWLFSDGEGEFDTLTSRNFRPGTNALKFLTGILGHAPTQGVKPNEHRGVFVNVIYGPNRNGKLTITDVMPLKKAGK